MTFQFITIIHLLTYFCQGLIDSVRINLNDIQSSQDIYRHIELRDRSLAENNFDRVNWYSTVCLVCTVSVMLIQVSFL